MSVPQTYERVDDDGANSPTQNYVGSGAMICEPCDIALVAPRTGYIASTMCPRCQGALKLRTLL